MMLVWCEWVGKCVDEHAVSKYCVSFFVKKDDEHYICKKCERSLQLGVGAPVEKLLEQLRAGD